GWYTGILCSSANCLTADAVSFCPRPALRSGWVYTATISCSVLSSAANAVAANSGVPANMIFTHEIPNKLKAYYKPNAKFQPNRCKNLLNKTGECLNFSGIFI